MKHLIFAIRDRASASFGRPNCGVSKGAMIRDFGILINDKSRESLYSQHPEDFDLFYLGEYDDNTGQFAGIPPEQIAVGKDMIIASV